MLAVACSQPSPAEAQEVLILQHNQPWGSSYWEAQLVSAQLYYDVMDTSNILHLPWADYDLVIVPSQQPGRFNIDINNATSDIDQYLAQGGKLILLLTTWTVYTPYITQLPLGASADFDDPSTYFEVAESGHPLMQGIPISGPTDTKARLSGYGNALVLSFNGSGNTTGYLARVGRGAAFVSAWPVEWYDSVVEPVGANALDFLLHGIHDVDQDGYQDAACGGDDCDDSDPTLNGDDVDGDGYSICTGDCALEDPSIHPGAAELCNGIDDDCDFSVPADEIDGDGDGFSPCEGDCDDSLASVYPGAAEVAGNGVDEDCAGEDVPAEGDDDDTADDDTVTDDDSEGEQEDEEPGGGDCQCRAARGPGGFGAGWLVGGVAGVLFRVRVRVRARARVRARVRARDRARVRARVRARARDSD